MNLPEALTEIRTFWTESTFPFVGGGESRLTALQHEFGRAFPPELRTYIDSVVSPDSFSFDAVGNAIDVYGFNALSKRLDGFNYNFLTGETLYEWDANWFLIGDEGADPIIVDLDSTGSYSPVLQARHGEGAWVFREVASSLAQFTVLLAARHHGLHMLPVDERIIDDELGFCLAKPAADWLFPRVKGWAPEHYDSWLGTFDNA